MVVSLKDRIRRHIQLSGPLPLAEYMHWCLADKSQGYYQGADPIGRKGDFITAPEVSQMFGELLAVWLIEAWKSLGKPEIFNLVELGPGKGTLMADMIRAAGIEPGFCDGAQIHMVETSERLTEVQKKKLAHVRNTHWHVSMETMPDRPSLIVANEFLDALPFRQYVKSGTDWHENCIGTDQNGNLSWVLGPGQIEHKLLPENHHQEPEGAVFEISTVRERFVEKICEQVSKKSGAALLIDYGHTVCGFGDTFQAVCGHAFTDPLAKPGMADLTSHVDFSPFKAIAEASSCNMFNIMTQGDFLLKLGLLERAGSLGAGQSKAIQARITGEAERLALPGQMGDLFKICCISSGPELLPFAQKGLQADA